MRGLVNATGNIFVFYFSSLYDNFTFIHPLHNNICIIFYVRLVISVVSYCIVYQ